MVWLAVLSGVALLLMSAGLEAQGQAAAGDEVPAEIEPASVDEVQPEEGAAEESADADATDAEAEAAANAAADQAALESELASAKRLKHELDALLGADGRVDATLGKAGLTRLAGLATRCGIVANSAMHDEARLVLLGYEARALAALVSAQPAGDDEQQAARRLNQLRRVARQIGMLDLPAAEPTADYWDLLAGLAQPADPDEPASARQASAQRALQAYIDAYAKDPLASEYVLDTRLSLAHLMDLRGDQRQAAQQLDAIGKLPADSPRLAEVKHLRQSIARIGSPIRIESVTTQLELWQSVDHLGKPVLIHIYADAVKPSVQMIRTIRRAIADGSLNGIAVVSLRVGDPIASNPSPPWPTLPVPFEPGGVLDQLGVTALPTLAWLDRKGQLASIGHTAAVLDQWPGSEPDAQNQDPQPDEPPADEAEPDEPQPDEPQPDEPQPEATPDRSAPDDDAFNPDESSPRSADPADLNHGAPDQP